MTKRGRSEARTEAKKMRRRTRRVNGDRLPTPLTCSIHGPGLDVDVRVEDADHLVDLARVLATGVGEGIAFVGRGQDRGGSISAPRPALDPQPADYDPEILRRTVAEDLRQMWNAMWKDGPVHIGDAEARDARFAAWVVSPAGQSIIDDALSGGLGEPAPADPKLRQN